jgi:hypothetical protein
MAGTIDRRARSHGSPIKKRNGRSPVAGAPEAAVLWAPILPGQHGALMGFDPAQFDISRAPPKHVWQDPPTS